MFIAMKVTKEWNYTTNVFVVSTICYRDTYPLSHSARQQRALRYPPDQQLWLNQWLFKSYSALLSRVSEDSRKDSASDNPTEL